MSARKLRLSPKPLAVRSLILFSEVFGFFCAVAGPAVALAFPLLFSGYPALRV